MCVFACVFRCRQALIEVWTLRVSYHVLCVYQHSILSIHHPIIQSPSPFFFLSLRVGGNDTTNFDSYPESDGEAPEISMKDDPFKDF